MLTLIFSDQKQDLCVIVCCRTSPIVSLGSLCADSLLSAPFPVEMSGHDMVCFDKTFEAAEALLHMESPGGLHNERSTGKHISILLDTALI